MTREAAFQSLENSLRATIDAWFDENQIKRSDEMAALRYVGDEASLLMARAAMMVIRSSEDVQDYLAREGQLVES